MKKLLSIVMSIVLVVGLAPLPAYAAEPGGAADAAAGGADIGDLTAAIADASEIVATTQGGSSLEIKGDEDGQSYWILYDQVEDGIVVDELRFDRKDVDVVIPSQIDGKPVIAIGYDRNGGFSWFRSNLCTGMTIPASVKEMHNIYFDGKCKNGVVFEKGSKVTELYPAAFKYYQGTGVQLPDGLLEISDNMFEGATSLESFVVPSATKSIGYRAFVNTPKMTSVTFNGKLETIEKEAFAHIPGTGFDGYRGGYYYGEFPHITRLDFPDSLTSIKEAAFRKVITLSEASFGTSPESSKLRTIGARAFFGTNLSSIVIPNSVESIGAEAFSGTNESGGFDGEWYGEHTIANVQFGGSQDASQLKFLGPRAFAQQPITSITLPNSLISLGSDSEGYGWKSNGDVGTGDFTSAEAAGEGVELSPLRYDRCNGKRGYSTHMYVPDGNYPVATMGAFSGCDQLETIVWPTQPGLTTVSGFDNCPALTEEAIESIPSWVSAIGDYAFYNCVTPGEWGTATTNLRDVTIPSTVARIGKGAFSKRPDGSYALSGAAPVYTLTNPAVQLDFDENNMVATSPWPIGCGYTIYYPASASPDSDIMKYRAAVEACEAEMNVQYNNSGGYYDYAYTHFIAVPDAEEAAVRLAEDTAPLTNLGTLNVTVKKNRPTQEERFQAAIGVNVSVFDAAGKLVAQGPTSTSSMFIANDLPEGDYTVVGFDGNDYFSSVSSLDDFARLGVEAGSWATQSATVVAAESTDLALAVPDLKMSTKAADILADGSVIVNTQRLVPDSVFYARVSYTMKDGRSANKITVNIPEGMQPVSAHTAKNAYGIGGYDASKHVLTVNLKSADAASGILYVGLKATVPGSYNVSASVASGAATAPLGSAEASAPALVLVAPTYELSKTSFDVDVYAAPGSTVRFAIGTTQLTTTATTNRVGHGTATLTIPDTELGGAAYLGHFDLAATVDAGTASAGATASQEMIYRSNRGDDVLATEQELSFKHAGQTVYLVRDGKNNDNVFYTAIMASHIRLENQSLWPFTSVFDSARPMADTATLAMRALDGSVLYPDVDLLLTGTEDVGGGITRYTYQADIPVGDGDDYLTVSEIPCEFEVLTAFNDEDYDAETFQWSASQEDVDAFKAAKLHTTELWRQSAQDDMSRGLRTSGIEEDEETQYFYQFAPRSYQALMAAGDDPDQKSPFDLLFNGAYKHENWDAADKALYNSLNDADKQALDEFEDAMDYFCTWWQEFYGDSKPMNEYANMEEYLAGEFGLQTGQTLDPKALEAEGYQVIYDNNAQAGECTWYAVKHEWSLADDEGTDAGVGDDEVDVSVQSDGSDDLTMTTQASPKKGKNVKGKGKVSVAKSDGTIISKGYDLAKDWWWGESGQARVKDAWGFVGKAVDKLDGAVAGKGSAFWKEASCFGSKLVSYVGCGLNVIVTVYDNLIQDAPRYWNRAHEIGKSANEIREKMASLRAQGKANTKCYQALMTEYSYLIKYDQANSGKILLSVADTVVTAEVVTLTVANPGGAAAAVVTSPEAGIAWSAGTYFAGKELAARSDAAKNTFERKRLARWKQCGEKEKLKHRARVGIDPSGYVFAGTEDNRLEGVTATIYERQEDGSWAKWDAEGWDQVNGQMTGSEGLFGWDVPAGTWKVVFGDDEYDSAIVRLEEDGSFSEVGVTETPELVVPPEWKNIAVGLFSNKAPTVVDATLDNYVATLTFDQPMKLSAAPTVTVNGGAATYEWVDSKIGVTETGSWEALSSTLKITLPASVAQKGGVQKLVVTGGEGYAGKTMAKFEKEWTFPATPASFKRLFGNVALDTMSVIVDEGWKGQVGGTVVIATLEGYWDALTAAGVAGMVKAPVLMTTKDSLSAQTEKVLKTLKPSTVIVCGGSAVVTDATAKAAANAAGGAKIIRCWGQTATGTAVDVFKKAQSEKLGTWSKTAFVCTNDGYWDALAAAPISYARSMPIFLTEGASDISAETLSAMKSGGIERVYIVGGSVVVNDSVAQKIEKSGIQVAGRLWGNTAVETSERVAEYGFTQGMFCAKMGVATTNGYWDALAGAPLCGLNNSVLLLAYDAKSHSVNDFAKAHKADIGAGYVFGGEMAVSKATYDALLASVK